jgi:plastocyanin
VKPFKEWKPWQRTTTIAVAALLVLYVVYAIFVSIPNGKHDDVYLRLGTQGSTMYLRCAEGSNPSDACRVGSDGNAEVFVGARDRVTFHIHNDDGGDHTHDFRLEGGAYWLWPAHAEDELHGEDSSVSFTAWKAGTFRLICELKGHDAAGMHAVLHVNTNPK